MIEAAQALERLCTGHRRFISETMERPRADIAWRRTLATGQQPFAAVLTCSDSRVPPELIFDQGFGDLFIIRVAGNILSAAVRESIAYSLHHLGVRLVVVMGHTKCGAIKETIAHGHAEHESELLSSLFPALTMARERGHEDITTGTACCNALRVAQLLETHDATKHLVSEHGCRVIPMLYDLDSNHVSVVDASGTLTSLVSITIA